MPNIGNVACSAVSTYLLFFSANSDGREKLLNGYYRVFHNGIPTPSNTVLVVEDDRIKFKTNVTDEWSEFWFWKAIYGQVHSKPYFLSSL